MNNNQRKIVLDTETTGMNKFNPHYKGHKIIEIGAIEIINRKITNNYFHSYIKPNRLIDNDAYKIHGIDNNFLLDKPLYSDIIYDFFKFINGSEVIIHNAMFDVGFINYESELVNLKIPKINNICKITDSLLIARKLFPGKRNNLKSLCSRYLINDNERNLHNALLDAKLLAKVYLAMTGGQRTLCFSNDFIKNKTKKFNSNNKKSNLNIIYANKKEISIDKKYYKLLSIKKKL